MTVFHFFNYVILTFVPHAVYYSATRDYILQGLEANANLMFSTSLAALGALMWLRKNMHDHFCYIGHLCTMTARPHLLVGINTNSHGFCDRQSLLVEISSSSEVLP